MVFQRNEGQEQDEILQNRFTSYLLAAVHRRRAQYIDEEVKAQKISSLMEERTIDSTFDLDEEALSEIPLYMRLQNEKLFWALSTLTERERYVFFACALEEKDYEKLATELGLSYKGVAAIYYRAIQKIKKKMKEELL